jgi:hypothetical protein
MELGQFVMKESSKKMPLSPGKPKTLEWIQTAKQMRDCCEIIPTMQSRRGNKYAE